MVLEDRLTFASCRVVAVVVAIVCGLMTSSSTENTLSSWDGRLSMEEPLKDMPPPTPPPSLRKDLKETNDNKSTMQRAERFFSFVDIMVEALILLLKLLDRVV